MVLSLATHIKAQDTLTPTLMIVGLKTFSVVDTLSITFEFQQLSGRYTVEILGDDAIRMHRAIQHVPVEHIAVYFQNGTIIRVEREAFHLMRGKKVIKIFARKVIYEIEPNALSIDGAFSFVWSTVYFPYENHLLEYQWSSGDS